MKAAFSTSTALEEMSATCCKYLYLVFTEQETKNHSEHGGDVKNANAPLGNQTYVSQYIAQYSTKLNFELVYITGVISW
jgi:hypothetical protein